MSRVLFNSFDHGHEEDPALAVALTVTVHPSVGPCFTFNGPDGEVEIVGSQAAREVADAIYRVLGGQAEVAKPQQPWMRADGSLMSEAV
jgi:predicted DsbA family dithiol-disulfide isomerase